ncbi:TonB-dependent receptor [Brevundimonas sp.]|uniref:TonB-dependent receptor n=1 Tax=Brevundimonas sp. TaxID=1871086 RepID=UPI003919D1C2
MQRSITLGNWTSGGIHMIRSPHIFSRNASLVLLGSVSAISIAAGAPEARAQDPTSVDEVIVTGTRRGASTVQDAPINISAIGQQQIEAQGIADLAEISRYVPGLFVVDQGPRNASRIIFRGLNATPLGESVAQSAGGTVATYLGDVPISIDLRLNDVERVEFLAGPQGTLYGAGTLAGAIRYIPNAPDFTDRFITVRGDAYSYSEGDGVSTDFGFTANLPITPRLAVRASVDQLNDQGFIDQPFLVREIGVSLPNPDFSDPTAVAENLYGEEDVNTEDVLSARVAVRWAPTDWLDTTLSYNYQLSDVGGRQVSGRRVTTFPVEVGEYEAIQRVREPNERITDLLALEATLDLGFADLTSATGYQTFEEDGQRDQTDLLISLEYSYEAFPAFTAYTRELEDTDTFTQELRLTSKPDSGPLSWILGGFYSKTDYWNSSAEYTPRFAEDFAVPEWGAAQGRPDNLEYLSVGFGEFVETALFGEVSWQISDRWQVTAGARRYTYEIDDSSATDLPLLYTMYYGRDPDEIVLDFQDAHEEEDGWLYKLNTSYELTDDVLIYATISDGYRIGGANGAAACPEGLEPDGSSPTQIVCALPNERLYNSEQTRNYEFGVKSQWFNRRLTLNGAVFYIDWEDPQVTAATVYGLQPITKNAGGAESRGFEVSFDAAVTEALTLRGSLSYTRARLTARTVNLVAVLDPPGFGVTYEDGEDGDRMPGSPEYQFSLYGNYNYPLSNGFELDFAYGLTASGDVESRMGGRGGGLTLPSFQIHNLSVRLSNPGGDWSLTGYIDNVWDEYAETGVRGTSLSNQILQDMNGDPVYARSHFTNVLPPRVIGVRFSKLFSL